MSGVDLWLVSPVGLKLDKLKMPEDPSQNEARNKISFDSLISQIVNGRPLAQLIIRIKTSSLDYHNCGAAYSSVVLVAVRPAS